MVGIGDQGAQRFAGVRGAAQRAGTGGQPQRRQRVRTVDGEIEIELEISASIEAARVDDAEMCAVEEHAPARAAPQRFAHRRAPERIEALAERRDDQPDAPGAADRSKRGARRRSQLADVGGRIEPECGGERRGSVLKQRSRRRGRTERGRPCAPLREVPTQRVRRQSIGRHRDAPFEKGVRDEVAVKSGQHRQSPAGAWARLRRGRPRAAPTPCARRVPPRRYDVSLRRPHARAVRAESRLNRR